MAYKYFFTDDAQKDLDNILDYLTNHLCNFNAAKSGSSSVNVGRFI